MKLSEPESVTFWNHFASIIVKPRNNIQRNEI